MKQVSIQVLKATLSEQLARVEGGERVVITRHNQPVAVLSALTAPHVHRGARFGRPTVRPLLRVGARGRVLAHLAADRDER